MFRYQAFLGAVLCTKPREYVYLSQRSSFYPRTSGLKIPTLGSKIKVVEKGRCDLSKLVREGH